MNDQTAQINNQNTYVDDYTPPTNGDNTSPTNNQNVLITPQFNEPSAAPNAPIIAPVSLSDDLIDATDTDSDREKIEDQNIFDMLGVTDGNNNLRENFLDNLQDTVWDEFLSNDIRSLISADEYNGFKKIQDKLSGAKNPEEAEGVQDEMIEYLEKLVPDLEDIMLEKALLLKEDLFRERIMGMRAYYASDQETLKKIDEADKMIRDGKWKSATTLLNSITA